MAILTVTNYQTWAYCFLYKKLTNQGGEGNWELCLDLDLYPCCDFLSRNSSHLVSSFQASESTL
jgi:hypothetical protein